jgi:hypothetical protein
MIALSLAVALAAPKNVLIVDGLLIGSLQGSRWRNIPEPPRVRSFPRLSLLKLSLASQGKSRMSATPKYEKEGPMGWFIPWSESTRGTYWSGPTPKPVRATTIDPKNATYRKILTDFLVKKGVIEPNLALFRGLQVDLDGDGKQEVLLQGGSRPQDALSQITAYGANFSDFSVVLLRYVDNAGKVADLPLLFSMLEGDTISGYHRLEAVANLDGDRTLEIITSGGFYEGQEGVVWRFANGKLTRVIDFAAGV